MRSRYAFPDSFSIPSQYINLEYLNHKSYSHSSTAVNLGSDLNIKLNIFKQITTMIFTNLLTLTSLLLTSSTAFPLTPRNPPTAVITLNGAAGASYSVTVYLDGSATLTNNALSISTVTSNIDVGALCTLGTVDYPPALVEGPPGTWAVGPPQTVRWISCKGSNPGTITIEFDGADPDQGAQYTLTVPLDGQYHATNNALSISVLKSSDEKLPTECWFDYVDYQAALVEVATGTWQVGPPQTIKGVKCS
jgi:hypothetical protein